MSILILLIAGMSYGEAARVEEVSGLGLLIVRNIMQWLRLWLYLKALYRSDVREISLDEESDSDLDNSDETINSE